MSAPEARATPGDPATEQPLEVGTARTGARATFGTIVVIGGGCYGSYYLRQLRRARAAGAVAWQRLVVVDHDPDCRVATAPDNEDCEHALSSWAEFLWVFLGRAADEPRSAAGDVIVPSPLMPHLLFDWLHARARTRHPERHVAVRPLMVAPGVPWQRASADGSTHYVSFAEWTCPINCIEPARCPATRNARDWTMPAAVSAHVAVERAAGHVLEGPLVFHCTHRAYGVGMIDVRDVLLADQRVAEVAGQGPADFLVGTVSHCHGALGILSVAG